MTVVDNYFDNIFNGGVRWHNRDVWPLLYAYMTLRDNAFTGLHQGYMGGGDMGGDSLYPEAWARAFVDYNRARVLPSDWVAFVGNTGIYKSLAEVQKKFGFDLHGEVKFCEPKDNDLTPESMGGSTVTFRIPWGPNSHLARPMLADSKIDGKWPAAPEYAGGRKPGFFWRVVDGDYCPETLAGGFPECDFELKWQPRLLRRVRPGREPRHELLRRCGRQLSRPEDAHRQPLQPGRALQRQPLAGDEGSEAQGNSRQRRGLVDALAGRRAGRERGPLSAGASIADASLGTADMAQAPL